MHVYTGAHEAEAHLCQLSRHSVSEDVSSEGGLREMTSAGGDTSECLLNASHDVLVD